MISTNRSKFCFFLALISYHFITGVNANEPDYFNFVIPSQRLSSSLITVSKQTRMPIIFYSKLTNEKIAPRLEKVTTVEQALSDLLTDSGLFYSIVENNFIIITEQASSNKDNSLTLEQIYQSGLEQVHILGHILTGSRIARSDFEGSTPVDVLRQPELDLRGSATIGEKLKFLPAVSGNPTSTAVTNGGDGTATVTLRGLPASNTLVLINGRRIAADGLEGDAIDLNTIAPAAIDRVEILKDGASSIYGADAIAGVVNIVMKENFDGFSLETFYGESSRGDMQTNNTNLIWGNNFERGSIFFSLTHFEQNGILSRDRTQSSNADGRSWGGYDARSSATPAARITLPSSQTVILQQDLEGNYLDPTDPSNFRPATSEDLYNYSATTAAFVPHEHKSVYSSLQFDLGEQVGLFLELGFDKTHAQTQFAPVPFTSAFETEPLLVSSNNLYNPFGVDIVDIRRRLIEMPVRTQDNDSTTTRLIYGLKGINDRWSWEAFYSWSYSNAHEKIANLLDIDKLRTALGPADDCTNPCAALNLFGAPGSITNDQIDFISTNSEAKGFSKLTTWAFNAVGPLVNLSTGSVDLATGIEYRQEATNKKPVIQPGQGLTVGGANFKTTGGARSIIDAYIETNLPLIKHKDAIKSLTLELSARYSHYSDFGETSNPKIGLTLRPSSDILLRSTWSKGFRAPSLNELYKQSNESYARLVDPCSRAVNVGLLPGCPVQTDSHRSQYLTMFNGNKDLQPERSINNTIGLVWSPKKYPGFFSAIDFFQIKQNNVIDANAQNILELNASTGAFPESVIRNSNGEIQKIIAKNFNVGKREVKGLDISSRYQFSAKQFGQYALAFNASHIHSYSIQASKITPSRDIVGTFVDDANDGLGAIPKWKANIGGMWKLQSWRGAYTIHYVNSLRETVPESNRERTIPSWITHDIQLGHTFKSDKTLLLAGIDNVFDTPPPRVASGFNDNLDTRTHEIKGRFFYLKLKQQF